MKKYYDDFTKLTLDKMAQKMSEITYEYETTDVPKAHYKKILQTETIEMIATSTSMELLLLNAVVTQLMSLQNESPKLFAKALMCIDKKIKVENIDRRTYDTLENVYSNYSAKCFLNTDIHDLYNYYYVEHPNLQKETDDF